MFPIKTVTYSKPSKQTSAAASKIKNKILSESAFKHLLKGKYDVSEFCQNLTLSHLHARHIVLLQGLTEDQQQGLGAFLAGPEGEEQAAGDAGGAPAEAGGVPLLRTGDQKVQAKEAGESAIDYQQSTFERASADPGVKAYTEMFFFGSIAECRLSYFTVTAAHPEGPSE